jgi:FlaA1/EpsC-like NDP-sugar epimerase
LKDYLLNLPRFTKRLLMVTTDFVSLALMAWIALVLRGDGFFNINDGYKLSGASSQELYQFILLAPFITIAALLKMRLYRSIIRYINVDTYVKISKACLISVVILAIGMITFEMPIPRFTYPIYFILATASVIYIRYTASSYLAFKTVTKKRNVLMVGTHDESIQIAEFLKNNDQLKPMGFIVSAINYEKSSIAELPVYSVSQTNNIIIKRDIEEILIIENKITKKETLEIIKQLSPHQKLIRKVPDISDYASGKIKVSEFKRIDIEDLLGRVAIKTDPFLLKSCIEDKTVMVTGAGGSIGSELARQIIQHKPKKIVLLEQSEYFLYKIDNEVSNIDKIKNKDIELKSYLGSVTDDDFVSNIFKSEMIDTVYHAAANKHVPLVEHNPISAIKTNIFGTKIVAENALLNNIENFVLISSDKAVRPTNIMGATKRFAELILQSMQDKVDMMPSSQCKTKFCMVRFGNVLDTSGSVVPLFRNQIKEGGPVTVTDTRVIRYFMTISEATELVIQAGSLSKGGEVFLLDMGEPMSILSLAKEMIKLSGKEVKDETNPDGDIEIVITGLRPGEKLYEELLIGDNVSKTIHDHIMYANEGKLSVEEIDNFIQDLTNLKSKSSINEVQKILYQSVEGYSPSKTENIIDFKVNS